MGLSESDDFWFPGRWIGGIALLIGPLLLLAGGLVRLPYDYFFPEQLRAFVSHPTQILVAYNLFLAGNILLFPAILTLIHRIGRTEPDWALWGGTFVMLGLFARTFHYGINHLAFQLVNVQGLTQATKAIADSYGAFHIVSVLSGTILFGWVILAIGAYRSRTLSLVRSFSLGLMSSLMLGVLKGSSPVSILALSGLCIALVPLGIDVLKTGSWPGTRNLMGWIALVVGLLAFMYFLGQAG
ncbi:hypothetical protein [Spirosoma aerolatum]|uniref:hypothetical protein n=1 Tax=Spirosoma aerolatum TaxID=1211326 RepID=UPI0009AE68A0|nr:hypothetical protein [Spirosoma aerolatum]